MEILHINFKEVQKFLSDFIKERMQRLKKWGVLQRTDLRYVSKKDLLQLQEVSDIVNGKPKGRMLEERFNEKSLPRGMRIRNRLYLK